MAKRAPKKQSAKRFRMKRVNPRTLAHGRVRSTATLIAVLDLPYYTGSGSDWNTISHNHIKKVQALDHDVTIVELDNPGELEVVGGAVLTVTNAIDVYLCLTLLLAPSDFKTLCGVLWWNRTMMV